MPATVSHLQLLTYFLKEMHYSVKDGLEQIPEDVESIEPVGLEITDITIPTNENSDWRCELTIESADSETESNPYYNFKIVMVGFFKTHPEMTKEHSKLLAETNCPAVLYSTSREIVATVTRRSPYPAVLLPLVTFVKTAELEKKPKTRAKKKPN
ncbi:MAG: protein-export chaperone SecB [Pyrinomonadaceae bacterium]|nr:protein-export chaperone SecB [Pyrinomonadaceae bacterium]